MNSFPVKRTGLLILIILTWNVSVRAQAPGDTAASKITAALSFYYKNYPREKIFIHTNAGVYIAGQTIWYKVYAQAYGKPSAISKIVYVQLTDTAGKVIVRNKLPMADGLAHGNIDLPLKLPSGWYQLRGFTAWMMNFNSDGFFKTKIYIKQLADSGNTIHPIKNTPAKYHIAFYPEGGDPVDGNECTIAFKATINDKLPVKVHGEVVDETNQRIAVITTIHDGMGSFSIKGHAEKIYKAIIHFPDSSKQVINLPAFKKEGIAMRVNNSDSSFVRINLTYTGSREKYAHVTLAAFEDNGTIVTHPLQLSQGISEVILKKELFSTGILRLTVFDGHNIPLAERVVFVNKQDMISLKLNADTLSFKAKAKCSFSIDAGKLPGNFSVSVRDYKTTDAEEQFKDNICSWMLVSSELRGSLYYPGYYFQNDADSLRDQLDLVMLTNGWRRFNWDTVISRKPVKLRYAPEQSQYIAGQLATYENMGGLKLKLIINDEDSSKYIGYITPDSAGKFILRDYEHSGLSTLYIEAADSKNHIKKVAIKLLNTLADSLKYMPQEKWTGKEQPSENVLKNIGTDNIGNLQYGKLLQTVHVAGRRISPEQQRINEYVTPMFHSITEYTLDLIDNPPVFENIFEFIEGRFPNLQIREVYIPHRTFIFTYRGVNTFQSSSPPYFYVDESRVTLDDVMYLNINEVALIRFIPPPAMFAPFNGGNIGAIMIYLKKGTDERQDVASREKFDQYTFNGYTITREFSSPDYSLPESRGLADNRKTLYWKPDLKTDVNGTARFSFYNSDLTKGYVVIIQGMDSEGHTAYMYKILHK